MYKKALVALVALVALHDILRPSGTSLLDETFTATNIVGTSSIATPTYAITGGTMPTITVCNASPPTAVQPASSLCINTSSPSLFQTSGGGVWAQVGAGGITGSALTTNVIPKASGSTSIGDSSITDDGTTVSTGELASIGNINGRTLINGPTAQTFAIPNAGYAFGEVNMESISGVVPAYPSDLFVRVIRNTAAVDATTHSQRTGGLAAETNVGTITGGNPVTAVGFECQATGGTVNNCMEALNGNVVIDNGNLSLNIGTIFSAGQITTSSGIATTSAGTFGLWLDGTPTDNIIFQDASARMNVKVAGPVVLEALGGLGGQFTFQVDGYVQIGTGTTASHETTKDGTARPTLSGCGSPGQALVGSDVSGKVTIGTGGATACVITFQTPYSANVSCTISRRNGALTSYSVATTGITANATLSAGDILDYRCDDH